MTSGATNGKPEKLYLAKDDLLGGLGKNQYAV